MFNSNQAEIPSSIYSNVCLKVKQTCLEVMWLPSYLLDIWKLSHILTVDVEQRNTVNLSLE